VKFLRHLSAVALVVAVIVGLGMLWAHASGTGGPGFQQAPPPQALQRFEHVKGRGPSGGTAGGTAGEVRAVPGTVYTPPKGFRLTSFDLTNSGVLIQTCEIEALLAAGVVTLTAIRRRQRRRRRATSGQAATS
jgi:hypothetical protein